jgi:cation-transporting ATPase 13A3/4/5
MKINTAGRISYMVFDKTGTLTNDGLNAVGHKITNGRTFKATIKDSEEIITNKAIWTEYSRYKAVCDDPVVKYAECMASCHSVAKLGDRILGDPLETEMFRQTDWILDEDEERNMSGEYQYVASVYPKNMTKSIEFDEVSDAYQIRIIKRFEFSSELQRMSVVARNNLDNRYICFIKGSPEMIHELSDPDSIPEEYHEALEKYTNNGLRVIALGYKYLDDYDYKMASECYREDVEENIQFLGLLIFANKLKAITGK